MFFYWFSITFITGTLQQTGTHKFRDVRKWRRWTIVCASLTKYEDLYGESYKSGFSIIPTDSWAIVVNLFLPIYLDPTPFPLAAGPGSTGSGNAIPGNEKTGKGLGTTTRAEARVVPDLELEAEVVRKRATGNGNVLTEKFRRKGELRFSKRKFETFLEMSTSLCRGREQHSPLGEGSLHSCSPI